MSGTRAITGAGWRSKVWHYPAVQFRPARLRRSPLFLGIVIFEENSMQVLRKFLCACVLIFLGATLAWASITGTISGIVTDASGSIVPDVTVTAINTQTGIHSVAKTDAKGFYSFPDLAVGTYNLQVEQKGF